MKLVSQNHHIPIIKILITKKCIYKIYKKLYQYHNSVSFDENFIKNTLKFILCTLNFCPYFICIEREI